MRFFKPLRESVFLFLEPSPCIILSHHCPIGAKNPWSNIWGRGVKDNIEELPPQQLFTTYFHQKLSDIILHAPIFPHYIIFMDALKTKTQESVGNFLIFPSQLRKRKMPNFFLKNGANHKWREKGRSLKIQNSKTSSFFFLCRNKMLNPVLWRLLFCRRIVWISCVPQNSLKEDKELNKIHALDKTEKKGIPLQGNIEKHSTFKRWAWQTLRICPLLIISKTMFPRIQIGLPDLVGQKDDIDVILMDHNIIFYPLSPLCWLNLKIMWNWKLLSKYKKGQ